MSIISTLFGTTPQTSGPAVNPGVNPSAVNPAATNPAHNPATALETKADGTTAPNGTVPATVTTETKSGIGQYDNLWETTANPNSTQGQPLFNIDNAKVMEIARTMDFTKDVMSPELAAKIAGGGQDAVQAMMQAMSGVAQATFAKSAEATMKLVEGSLKKEGYVKQTEVDDYVRKHSVSTALREQTNPIFKSQAAQPIIKGLEQQFTVKFPNATPSEVAGMVNDYLTQFSSTFTAPAQQAQAAKAAEGETDWSKFMQ